MVKEKGNTMLTEIQSDLIGLLKSLGIDKETTLNIVVLAKTDEIREKLIQKIVELYMEKGEATEQDVQKILFMLTVKRKKEVLE